MSEQDDQEIDGDEDLLQELEIWAHGKDSHEVQVTTKTKNQIRQSSDIQHHHQRRSISPPKPIGTKQLLSLHITNLPESADKASIHEFFSKSGCSVTSVRLVYDQTSSRGWNNRTFKGVAFIDLGDKKSYEKALSFHRTWFPSSNGSADGKKEKQQIKKSRINVRPTRTKEELAAIVQSTKERVEFLKKDSLSKKEIVKEHENQKMEKSSPVSSSICRSNKRKREDDSKPHGTPLGKKQITQQLKNGTGPSKRKGTDTVDSKNNSHRRFTHRGRKNTDRALTKKERAKKAAIIRSK